MHKRGVELSINFVVTLIIALIVFAAGIVLISRFFASAEETMLQLDAATERQLEGLLDTGERIVVLGRNSFSKTEIISPGGTAQFGIGVLNVESSDQFSVRITLADGYDEGNRKITPLENWIIQSAESTSTNSPLSISKTIPQNTKEKILLGITPPSAAQKGTYIFNVDVCRNQNNPCTDVYGKQKLYVRIK